MNKKIYISIGIVILVLLLVFFIPKYLNGNVAASDNLKVSSDIEKVEVYHFHATSQCYSCKTVGSYAEETVNTYFSNELKYGKIVFASVNIELPENKALADKYDAKGSSLLIGVYERDGNFSKQEDTTVWYKISNKQDYMNYLKSVIESKLSGE